MEKVEITLKRGLIGQTAGQKSAVRCLGLNKPGQSVVRPLNAVTKGQINKVKHLVLVRKRDHA